MKVVFFQRKPHPFHFSIENVFEGIKKSLPVEVEVSTAVMPFFSQGFWPRLRNIFWSKENQGDINHITGDIHFIALGLKRKKTILTIHDLNFLNHPNPIARFILKTFWLTLPLKKIAYVTVISEATKRHLLSVVNFPESRIKVIPNYYDEGIRPRIKDFNSLKPRILQIGTKQNKNISRLIEALNGVPCHLVIVGNKVTEIERLLLNHGVEYTWLSNLSRQELLEQYEVSDLLSFVSTVEGFGLPILEAQAMGRVVLTSSVSSMPEVAGGAACLVNPFDVDSIRKGLLRIMQDDSYRDMLIGNGFKNLERFSIQNVIQLYVQTYNEVWTN